MSIIFGYFQYFDHEYLVLGIIPSIIDLIFSIILNYFIIRSSKRQLDEIEKPFLLFYIGLINICFFSLPFIIPTVAIISPTGLEIIFAAIFMVLQGLISSLPFFLTYGVLLFQFGRLNEIRYKKYLKISAIVWMITNGFRTITLNDSLFGVINFLTNNSLSFRIILIFLLISGIFGFIDLVGWVIFLIHSVKNKDKNLFIAGTLKLIAHFVIPIYINFFNPYLYGLLYGL